MKLTKSITQFDDCVVNPDMSDIDWYDKLTDEQKKQRFYYVYDADDYMWEIYQKMLNCLQPQKCYELYYELAKHIKDNHYNKNTRSCLIDICMDFDWDDEEFCEVFENFCKNNNRLDLLQ